MLGIPNPSPTPLVFGNLLTAGEGEADLPEADPGVTEFADVGVHGVDPGRAETEATRDVGDNNESNPEEKDDERPCVGLRLCCGAGCGWCSDDVMSIRPPPTTPRFRSAARMELRV